MTQEPEPSRAPADQDQATHLHVLAERIHHAADDLSTPPTGHPLASTSEEIEDQIRAVTGIFAALAGEAAFHGRAAERHPGTANLLAHRKIALLTRAADPLGRALAHLGQAVAQIGRLHEISAGPRTPEQAQALRAARTVLTDQLRDAYLYLSDAAGSLHRDADQLITTVLGTQRAPTAPSTGRAPLSPTPPVPTTGAPTATRTLR
ncbi:hypothetical protein GPA10_37455 [Streptomyces sp. p1417]|uniref:Uncharacterized protein n=1 Tax=Streptomyces typhae TaxID=2681492 RepID=A0A6L6X8U5_9ACTN|nr:hypothetical protein [Streptomyces typhae]MVO90288.1 hypothetical protein [Streptomyces typhae]